VGDIYGMVCAPPHFIASFVNKKAEWKIQKLDIICGILSFMGLFCGWSREWEYSHRFCDSRRLARMHSHYREIMAQAGDRK